MGLKIIQDSLLHMLILHSIHRRLQRFRCSIRGLSTRDILPLMVVVPIILYAYLFQIVVTNKSLDHQANNRLQDLKFLSCRISAVAKSMSSVCRDYAHWDDTYQIISSPDSDNEWFEANFEQGIGANFGYEVVILQDSSGRELWSSANSISVHKALRKYSLLKRSLSGHESSGIMQIGSNSYVYAAMPVLMSDHSGSPRGMLFTASRIDSATLGEMYEGVDNKLAFVQANGDVVAMENLGQVANMPPTLDNILRRHIAPSRPTAEPSQDGNLSFGYLPITDSLGNEVGTMVDIASRVSLAEHLRAVKHMSAILTLLCAVFGGLGTCYIRNRNLVVRAHRDELTGLYNHRYLQEYLRNELQRAERYTRPVSVLMVDIDHFKVINDTYGHSVGDQALKAVADILAETVRDMDIVARYGGEEFVVVLPEAELSEAIACAQRLRRAVQARKIHARSVDAGVASTIDLQLTISIGVAAFPEDGQGAADLINAADTALSGAKRTRNTVFAYKEILDDQSSNPDHLASLGGFLRDSSMSSVRPLVASIDTRDPGSAHHSEKTAEYAVAIGLELGFTTQELSLICKAALLHDVGKIGIPDYILTKHGKLTSEEMEIVRQHPSIGADILSKSPLLAPVSEIVRHHHERFDGSGYPDKLSGEQTSLMSRVLAVADTLDAMTSQRAYHKPVPMNEAAVELQRQAGKQFDPVVVDVAVKIINRITKHVESGRQAA